MHHTAVPDDFVYTYSWANQPEEWQPTGHINAFRCNDLTLVLRREIDTSPTNNKLELEALCNV